MRNRNASDTPVRIAAAANRTIIGRRAGGKMRARAKGTAKRIDAAAIATGMMSHRSAGRELPIAKTIAVLTSRITMNRAANAWPSRAANVNIDTVRRAMLADRATNRLSSRLVNARLLSRATRVPPRRRRKMIAMRSSTMP